MDATRVGGQAQRLAAHAARVGTGPSCAFRDGATWRIRKDARDRARGVNYGRVYILRDEDSEVKKERVNDRPLKQAACEVAKALASLKLTRTSENYVEP